jgi:hypothetical protein
LHIHISHQSVCCQGVLPQLPLGSHGELGHPAVPTIPQQGNPQQSAHSHVAH